MSGGHDAAPQVTQWPDRNPYFGAPWDAPAVDGARQVPAPVGTPCAWCSVPVCDGDQGFLIACARLDKRGKPYGELLPFHRECRMRSMVGSPAHLDGRCSCHAGEPHARPETPAQMRAEALEVWRRIHTGRLGPGPAADTIHES